MASWTRSRAGLNEFFFFVFQKNYYPIFVVDLFVGLLDSVIGVVEHVAVKH